MNNSQTTKHLIPQYTVGNKVLDFGCEGGVMLDKLIEHNPNLDVLGVDLSIYMVKRLREIKEQNNCKWNIEHIHEFEDRKEINMFDTIVFSSVLHEVYSISPLTARRFDINNVKCLLRDYYHMHLKKGGRIIIRDGIRINDICQFAHLKINDSVFKELFDKFQKDFKGLEDITHKVACYPYYYRYDYYLALEYIREFIYTATWGMESFSREVSEQFGYFTLKEWRDFLENDLGANILVCEECVERGYRKHFEGKFEIYDEEGNKMDYPNSTCFIVIEKR